MSLVPLRHVTFVGLTTDKEGLLNDLHARGCVELIPLGGDGKELAIGGPSSEAREALLFLLTCPQRRHQVMDDAHFDAQALERQSLELRQKLFDLEAERDALRVRIADVEPWGEFRFPDVGQLGGCQLWFYVVPHEQLPRVAALGLDWEVVRRDLKNSYVVVASAEEPRAMPVPRVHVGARSPSELKTRLAAVELAIEDAQAERSSLTRWCLLFSKSLDRLEDSAARSAAARQTCDRQELFALQAWAPAENISELSRYAVQQQLVFESREPTKVDAPPTLLRNPPRIAAGEDLVNFYMTPGYWTWDPSGVVLISFAIFFAMILADAGYAAVLGLGLAAGWGKLSKSASGQRFLPLLSLIVGLSLVYGVLVGSYFGLTPPEGSLLGALHLLDMNNSGLMMGLSVLVGGVHVLMANVIDARRYSDRRDGLPSVGWACAIAGGLVYAAGSVATQFSFFKAVGGVAVVGGLLLVVGFTAWREKPIPRIVQGLLGLTKLSGAFGDILSYLRLFALGLASASLATAFNEMAAGISSGLPGIGMLLALLVLLFGHTLNLLLGISSGVIHGLRLNVIEFFNWGLKDEGRLFRPFRRKEDSTWT